MKKILSGPEIGERLRHLRGSLSQRDMARKCDTAIRAYQYYESGERLPSLNFIAEVASAFNTTTDWILTGSDKPRPVEEPRSASSSGFDINLMLSIIEKTEVLFEKHKLYLPPRKKVRLFLLLYEDILEDRTKMDVFDEKVISITRGLAV